MYISGCSSRSAGSIARNMFMFWFCTRLIDSRPPATTTGMPSWMTCLAPMAIAIIPEEHCRSTVMPLTVSGNPAAIAA